MMKRRRRESLVFWSTSVVTLLFGVGMLSKEFKKPSEFWQAHAEALQWSLLGLGVTSQVLLFYRSWRLRKDRQLQQQDDDLRDTSRLLVVHILDTSPGVKATSLGVHVWIARGWFTWRRRLCRRISFNLHQVPPSGVRWTSGKGVIGTCFSTGVEQTRDLRAIASAVQSGSAAFMALSEDDRMGLSFDEFSKVRRYSFIHAWPLKDEDGLVVGCVSVDYTDNLTVDALAVAIQQPMLTSFVAIINEAVRNGEE